MHRPLFAAAWIASAALAQLPVAPGNNVQSTESHTWGFYCQLPADCVVTALQVPDDMNEGAQVVAIYRFAGPPPQSWVYAAPSFFAAVGNSDVIAVQPGLAFKKNDWFGVLGACGTARAMLRNPTGKERFASRLLGQPVTLLNLEMNSNLGNNRGVGTVSSNPNASTARIRVFVTGHGQALRYGASSRNAGWLTVGDSNPPSIGQVGAINVAAGTSDNLGAVLLIGIGRNQVPWPPYGTLYVGVPFVFVSVLPPLSIVPNPIAFPIPDDTRLLNMLLNFQAGVLTASALDLTNAIEWTIGR